VSATPTVKFDGSSAGYSPSTYPSSITNRLAEPCYLDIDVSFVGDATGGTAYYSITAEQDLGTSGQVKIHSVITEDHDMAGSGWGYYIGMEMMWLPVGFPLGSQGNVVDFTGPYPQTIDVSGTYSLNPIAHTFDNLNVVTYVQASTGAKQILNANYMDLPDTATGIVEDATVGLSSTDLTVWPNPSTGSFSIGTVLTDGVSGSVSVFSLAGRTVEYFDASPVTEVTIPETGIYFVVLETSNGECIRERFTVVD